MRKPVLVVCSVALVLGAAIPGCHGISGHVETSAQLQPGQSTQIRLEGRSPEIEIYNFSLVPLEIRFDSEHRHGVTELPPKQTWKSNYPAGTVFLIRNDGEQPAEIRISATGASNFDMTRPATAVDAK